MSPKNNLMSKRRNKSEGPEPKRQKQQIIENIKTKQDELRDTDDWVYADKFRQQLRNQFSLLHAAGVRVQQQDGIHIGLGVPTIETSIMSHRIQSFPEFKHESDRLFLEGATLRIKMFHISDREVPTIELQINDEPKQSFDFEACFWEQHNFIRLMTTGRNHLLKCADSVNTMAIVTQINNFFYGTVSRSDYRVPLGFADHRVRNPPPGQPLLAPGQLGRNLLAQLRF